jgi:murein DD-endopeptidase MepM/ murein hydrolase activator NlpD
MRPFLRILLLSSCLTTAAVPASAGSGRRPDPTATVEKLRGQANEAARRYSETEAESSRLADELAQVEGQVGELERRLALLRTNVTRRAVAVYQSGAGLEALVGFGYTPNVLESARDAKLAAEVNAQDTAAGAALAKSAAELRDRRHLLIDRRGQAEHVLRRLEAQRGDLDKKLVAFIRPGQGFESRGAERRPVPRVSRSKPGRVTRAALALPSALSALPADFVCPIKGPVAYSRDFGTPRPGGRRHAGNDLHSPRGTENVAVVAGTVESRSWGDGGLVVSLVGDDGNEYLYMHLLRLVGPMPRRVEQSEVIALTGSSGNARGYHTHFEFHPGGGPAVDPYPLISTHC